MDKLIYIIVSFFVGVLIYYLMRNYCSCKVVEGNEQKNLKKDINPHHYHKNELAHFVAYPTEEDKIRLLNHKKITKTNIIEGQGTDLTVPNSPERLQEVSSITEMWNTIQQNRLREHIENGSDLTYDIEHVLGDIRNQHAMGTCWLQTIAESIDSAYYNYHFNKGIPGRLFRASTQQLLDCLGEDLEEYSDRGYQYLGLSSTTNLNFVLSYINIINRFYIDSNRNIYHERDYPSIVDNCSMGLHNNPDSGNNDLRYCNNDCINLYDNYVTLGSNTSPLTSMVHVLSGAENCEKLIEDGRWNCETGGMGGKLLNICDNTCGKCNNNICSEGIDDCGQFIVNDVADPNLGKNCTYSPDNICNQSCRGGIQPRENIIITDFVLLEHVNDNIIYSHLLNNTIMAAIHVTPDILHLDSNNCYITFDEHSDMLYWKPLSDDEEPIDIRPSNAQLYSVNHAVAIVGAVSRDDKYYWKVRNSWGKEWGDGGHFYVERDVNDEKYQGQASLFSINNTLKYNIVDVN